MIQEQLICSIIYLLLVEKSVRQAGVQLGLKDVLLKRMIAKKNSSYDSIVQYIIERMDLDEDIDEAESD